MSCDFFMTFSPSYCQQVVIDTGMGQKKYYLEQMIHCTITHFLATSEVETGKTLGHVTDTPCTPWARIGVLAQVQGHVQGLCHDIGPFGPGGGHRRVGENVGFDWSDQHVLRPTGLQMRGPDQVIAINSCSSLQFYLFFPST